MTYQVEEWRRRAKTSQRWADRARVDAEETRRDHRWFLALAVLVAVGSVCAALLVVAPLARAHHGRFCHSRSCEVRVFNRTQPWQRSIASVYDGVGLGGRVACKGYWPGGYVLAHKTLPCGTRVRICYRRCVTATVWDRGPYVAGREFDLDVGVQRATGFPWGVAASA